MESKSIFKSKEGKAKIFELYDLELSKWPTDYKTSTVSTSFGDTFIIESGMPNTKPLILIHGASGNSTLWINDIEKLSEHYHVFAIDVIGEPGKSAPTRPERKGNEYAIWLSEVFDGLNIENPSIVGISQGGFVALKFAIEHPQDVDKLVLLCPAGIVPDKVVRLIIRFLPLLLLGSKGLKKSIELFYGSYPVPKGVARSMRIITKHFSPRSGLNPTFSDGELKSLNMPTLLIGGTKDVMRSFKSIETRLSKFLGNLSSHPIDGGGHVLVDTSDIMLSFLEKE